MKSLQHNTAEMTFAITIVLLKSQICSLTTGGLTTPLFSLAQFFHSFSIFISIYFLSICLFFGAGDGNRTHATSLEGWSSTIELHPRRDDIIYQKMH